jgi:hypothetical protein
MISADLIASEGSVAFKTSIGILAIGGFWSLFGRMFRRFPRICFSEDGWN